METLKEAEEMRERLIALRHFFHRNAEIGMDLPVTAKKVKDILSSLNIEYKEILPCGIRAVIGKSGGKSILLRADMDALRIEENTGLEFKSENKGAMHACGHDLHTTMLLGAAMLLKKHEQELGGQVVLMFQPGEEGYNGALHMIAAGVLEPKPDYAVALHIAAFEEYPTGIVAATPGIAFASRDEFNIMLKGKGGHGAEPHKGKNPIYAALKIIESFTDLSKFEVDASIPSVLTVCQIHAGTASNVVPEQCRFNGTLRMVNEDMRSYLLTRMKEIAEGISAAYGMECEFLVGSSQPMLKNDEDFTKKVHSWLNSDLAGAQIAPLGNYLSMGSEDFAFISRQIPSCYLHIISQSPKGKHYPEHNENVVFDDEAVWHGAAVYTQIAVSYFNH